MAKKVTKKGYIISYSEGPHPDMGQLKDEKGNIYSFLIGYTKPEVQDLLQKPEEWEDTFVYFETWEENGQAKTGNLRLKKDDSPLFGWAYFKGGRQGYEAALEELKQEALPEIWGYHSDIDKNIPASKKYPILHNYFQYTFEKLTREEGGIIYDGEMAVFNTGLVNYLYQAIYAVFKKNTLQPEKSPWFFDRFVVSETTDGKELNKRFSKLPGKARFFSSLRDLVYECDENNQPKKPNVDFEHILFDNFERLPKKFVKEKMRILELPESLYDQLRSMTSKEREENFKGENKDLTYDLVKAMNDALSLTLLRLSWNYKTAIPMWYPRTGKICFLLPLSLSRKSRPSSHNPGKPEVALIVEWQEKSQNYQAHTILPLNLAYSNARLICRPDSDWLQTDNFLENESDEDSEE